MRKRLWQLHSWLGLICGLALLVIGLTGSVLVFHEEISKALHPETVLNADRSPDSERRPVSELATAIENKFPNFWIRGWLLTYDSEKRDKAYVMERGGDQWHILYVDPYTAETAARPFAYPETLYGWFVELHYTFFADHLGVALAGIFAIGFILLGVSGIYLHRPFFKALFRLRWGASARILFSDLHKAIGIATIPFNLILGFTGAYWNITHIAHDLIEHADEEEEATAAPYPAYRERVDALPAAANAQIPGYALNYIYFPTAADPTFYLYGQHPGAGALNSPYGSSIWMSAETGEVTHVSDLRQAGFWARIEDAFEPLHFGNFGGLATKILWSLAGLSPAALSLTGTLIYLKRRRRKPAPQPATRPTKTQEPEVVRL